MAKKKESAQSVGVTPLGERVLVRPLLAEELEKKSPSGIIIPEAAKTEKPAQGVVVALGKGRTTDDGAVIPISDVTVGDTVVFSKYGYEEVSVNDTDYYILRVDQILAVIK
ncbi:co-chaperone GroES [Candidatus Kaiserbacteria bacterium CG10_big_fil_rev_8_21_14_0_10_49_17]|uniref:Co-chaperonin GroES n=1 Tax=Candidatus Kaiserbacteria bacterium CG10_big_fil_rev_8_21_14_0_10_49_17 TaxID=1974609 RepID=A0A2M6WES0_9BACT|nr:MAG: co-chaperone GroES [Candidatus Kaiserbacteria bacterium CG10_big_fil_rev_8_21_14_0_10_49_17]